jgi:hypothetical protein
VLFTPIDLKETGAISSRTLLGDVADCFYLHDAL